MSSGPADADEVKTLVERVRNLHEGPLVLPDVVALGEPAVPALEVVLRGPSGAIHHARCLAADALAAMPGRAATAALTRALRDSIARHLDPISAEAEGVVVNRIAEHLSGRAGAEATEALLEALITRCYPQCARALGRLGEPRAIPLLIECLYDDAARSAAVEALGRFDGAAVAPLCAALLDPLALNGLEAPSRVDGRTAAARLLGRIAVRGTAQTKTESVLHAALHDRQRAIRIEAALALVRSPAAALEAATVLVTALDEENWARADVLMRVLVSVGELAGPLILPLITEDCGEEAQCTRRQLRAIELAGRLGSPAALRPLASLSGAAHPALRLAAIHALDLIATCDDQSFARFLEDEEPTVRRRSAAALLRRHALDPARAVELLGDSDWGVSRLAVRALREAGSSARPALKGALAGFGAPARGVGARWRLWWRAGWVWMARPARWC